MLSVRETAVAPIYLELAPPQEATDQVVHLFVFRDSGVLSGGGKGRFATDLFTLSASPHACRSGAPRLTLELPRSRFTARRAPFSGIVAGLRLSGRPEGLPSADALVALDASLRRARTDDDAIPSVVAALDGLARRLTFAARPRLASDRTERRRSIADTGVSRRRLAAIRRFRLLLESLASRTVPLSDLALESGFFDQSHMSASCRVFAGAPPRTLHHHAVLRRFGHLLQEFGFADRVRLVIMDKRTE